MSKREALIGCLLGTAVGDALGLPFEGLTVKTQRRMCPEINGHNFLFGRGMISDDTEHACMTAGALTVSGGNGEVFLKSLAWRLRFWLLALPAGVGFATLRSGLRLLLGTSGKKSGVKSAGNGPAMRSPIIGVAFGQDAKKMTELVRQSTLITHTDERAVFGAMCVAVAAYLSCKSMADTTIEITPQEYFKTLNGFLTKEEPVNNDFYELIVEAIKSVENKESTEEFAKTLGIEHGITGYMLHTVPVVIHVWLSNPKDYKKAIIDIIRCGGDTDTTAAILGGIVGAGVGKSGIPEKWLDGIFEWPRTLQWMEKTAEGLYESLEDGKPKKSISLSAMGVLFRNIFFMHLVLFHGFRRLIFYFFAS